MITGDHAVTAAAIARAMGMRVAGNRALTGAEIEAMDETALRQAVREVNVFARASPEHKLRLVEAMQANGEVASMTGDGVNDAPALKRADVGVAMGHKGTEAAKEAAEMVLADDNFASIAAAVEEGRAVYDNLREGGGLCVADQRGPGLDGADCRAARHDPADHAGADPVGEHGHRRDTLAGHRLRATPNPA